MRLSKDTPASVIVTAEALKTRQRKERDQYCEGFGLRIHRAISWLARVWRGRLLAAAQAA